MPEKTAVFDNARSFYRYLAVSRKDRDWGLFVSGTGHEVMSLQSDDAAVSAPYHFDRQPDPREGVQLVFDPSYPQPYRYDWEQGRTLVDEFGLLFVNDGSHWSFEVETFADPIDVSPGSIILLFPGVWHRYRPLLSEEHNFTSTLWCHFGGDIPQRWQQRRLFSPERPVLPVGNNSKIESVFRRLHNSVQSGDSICLQQSLAAGMMELLGNAEAAAQMSAGPVLSSDIIHQAKALLDDLSIAHTSPLKIARILQCPYDQFRRSFKIVTGMSPHQYRLQAVVRRAKELLEATDMTVKDIAAVLRFSDQFYFTKIFKRKTGATPTEWRSCVHRDRQPPRA